MTILLIDDKAANIFALEQLLQHPERTFVTALTGEQGLKLAFNQAIDLIILDVQMPDMDGFEVAQLLKSNNRTKDIPIIFASAEKKDRSFMIQGLGEGAIDYLTKPLDPEITQAKVSVLLKVQQQKKELVEKNAALEHAEKQIKQLIEELQGNLEQVISLNKELEMFSYSISHDLRSPLRALNGYATMVREDLADSSVAPRVQGNLQRITDSAIRMDKMLNGLLEFSRLGRKEIKKTTVDMGRLVNQTLAELMIAYAPKTDVVIHELFPIEGDEMLLSHVWMNLLSNAIKFSSRKETPMVEVGSQLSDEWITYFVKDNGVGFDEAYAEKLFGVFQRLHSVKEFEGTGIGLAIVQRIILKHGGTIRAESQQGIGTTFYFALPRKVD
jgi:two-component system, sensor histidine kinase and response regulator